MSLKDIIYKLLGYEIYYVSSYGIHSKIYDSTDLAALRPVHKDMSVAPPWATKVYNK